MFIDSHCHLDRLDLAPFNAEFALFMREAEKQEVRHLLCVGIDLESYAGMRRLVDGYDNVSVSVGVHPNEHVPEEPTVEKLVSLARDSKVVAVGETGLDYYRSSGSLDWQRERFRQHIRAARLVGKPLIIHSREARNDTIELLIEERADEVGGVFHCFTEDWETARRVLDLGFYISFSGIVTFRSAQSIQEVAKKIPEDRFLIETDSPYLAPVPFRGKPNYPYLVRYVAQCIAGLRGVSLERVAELSSDNFYRLFAGARA
ncbi:TatD family hydrolase [Methylocaldum szegediense]|uniref:Metal-dependent hydrolase YcfH n=1 Tax=Methylocaldum szegediense TaxID=73780 RepID=A0ABN8XBJ5_9GAMM|nr:TatD family hydrolase [Methylocaldum szegediense]CAI8954168.1 putative metal-dependent hydrolase YcfH [Methylocaldum szegediense]